MKSVKLSKVMKKIPHNISVYIDGAKVVGKLTYIASHKREYYVFVVNGGEFYLETYRSDYKFMQSARFQPILNTNYKWGLLPKKIFDMQGNCSNEVSHGKKMHYCNNAFCTRIHVRCMHCLTWEVDPIAVVSAVRDHIAFVPHPTSTIPMRNNTKCYSMMMRAEHHRLDNMSMAIVKYEDPAIRKPMIDNEVKFVYEKLADIVATHQYLVATLNYYDSILPQKI